MAKKRTFHKKQKGEANAPSLMHWDAPVKAGFHYEVTVHGVGSHGEGVAKHDGFTVFVPNALPGEVVKVYIEEVKKSYARARLEEILLASPERVEPPCPVYFSCGGCRFQHLSKKGQLELKEQMVREVMKRIGKVERDVVKPTIGMEGDTNYRNKMQLPVGGLVGDPLIGFYAAGTHDIVPCLDCLIQDEANNEVARTVHTIAKELQIPPYDEISGEGILRHVVSRVGKDNKVMVVLVVAKETIPNEKEWIERLHLALPNMVSLYLNVNSNRTNIIMGRENRLLWGEERLTASIGELEFLLSLHSFFQVNPEGTIKLYGKALEYAALTGEEEVIDAYCGTGTISLFLAKQAKRVIGIEIVEPAILDARVNAELNGIKNAEFVVGDVTKVLPEMYEAGLRPDVLVMDPARAGCEIPVLEAAAKMNPKRIVYVSCNPASLARDIAILAPLGYEVVEITPVDMFPFTSHVECVALIERKKP